MGIDSFKSIGSLILSVLIFVSNLFDKCLVLCLYYSIFFNKFIGLKTHVSIISNKLLPKNFYAMFLTFKEFATNIALLINILKVKRRYIHRNRFAYVTILATFIAFIAIIDRLSINSTDVFGQKINALKVKR